MMSSNGKTVLDGTTTVIPIGSGSDPEPALSETPEEMQGYIYGLNARIVQGGDVSDAEITKALLFQRALNQHNLERKTTRARKAVTPAPKLNLEDL